jgi:hypothetical protein
VLNHCFERRFHTFFQVAVQQVGKNRLIPKQIAIFRRDVGKRQASRFQAALEFRILNSRALLEPHGIAIANRDVQQVTPERRAFLRQGWSVAEFVQGTEQERAIPKDSGLPLVAGHSDMLNCPGHRLPQLLCLFECPFLVVPSLGIGYGYRAREGISINAASGSKSGPAYKGSFKESPAIDDCHGKTPFYFLKSESSRLNFILCGPLRPHASLARGHIFTRFRNFI